MDDNLCRYVKFLPLAIKLANKSSHHYKHSAILIKRNRVLDVGINQEKTHPRAKSYYNNFRLHAEQHCLMGNKLEEVKNSDMLTVRIDWNGQLKCGRPCHVCFPLIAEYGIRRIIYSTNEGNLESVEL